MVGKKITLRLKINDVNRRGSKWVADQMIAAGMKLYPYRFCGSSEFIVIEGVAA